MKECVSLKILYIACRNFIPNLKRSYFAKQIHILSCFVRDDLIQNLKVERLSIYSTSKYSKILSFNL